MTIASIPGAPSDHPDRAGAPEMAFPTSRSPLVRRAGAGDPRTGQTVGSAGQDWIAPQAESSPLARLAVLAAPGSPVHAIPLPAEILEVAEEIACGSDVPGLERDALEFLLRVALFLDGQRRDSQSISPS